MTDKDCPIFDAFQDIQSQNNFSTTQLNVMGYKGEALKSQFMENEIRERQAAATVIVPQTCKCQEAIATKNLHGKMFLSQEASMSPLTTCSKGQKSTGRLQTRPQRWRMARIAR